MAVAAAERGGRNLIPHWPVSILGLQDADKIGHAGPIPVVGHHWNLIIRCGLVLPNPPQEIGNLLHGGTKLLGVDMNDPLSLITNPPPDRSSLKFVLVNAAATSQLRALVHRPAPICAVVDKNERA